MYNYRFDFEYFQSILVQVEDITTKNRNLTYCGPVTVYMALWNLIYICAGRLPAVTKSLPESMLINLTLTSGDRVNSV